MWRIGRWRKLGIGVRTEYIKIELLLSHTWIPIPITLGSRLHTGGLAPPPLRVGFGMAYAGSYLEAGDGKEVSHVIEKRLSLGCNSKCCPLKHNPKISTCMHRHV